MLNLTLNDTTVDGFLGNLRNPEKFIKMDSKWNASMMSDTSKPPSEEEGGTIVEDAVGLLNMYEYQSSNNGGINGYLNNGLYWWTLTPLNTSTVRSVNNDGNIASYGPFTSVNGVRPSINLKSSVRIVDGDGTIDNPYRLNGDNDTDLSGTLLSSRYSGEYIKFGNDENNLYRIVSHENRTGTKITSTEPLKSSESFITSAFGSNTTFSSTNTIGMFLNGDYLTSYVGDDYANMIEDSTTWYLGTVGSGASYKLAKYTDTNMSSITGTTTNAKVGLLRYGELMTGQFERYTIKNGGSSTGLTTTYWTLTPYNMFGIWYVSMSSNANTIGLSLAYGVHPSLNLKSNVIITGGDGTLQNNFKLNWLTIKC